MNSTLNYLACSALAIFSVAGTVSVAAAADDLVRHEAKVRDARVESPLFLKADRRQRGNGSFDGLKSGKTPTQVVRSVETAKARALPSKKEARTPMFANATGAIKGYLGYHNSLYGEPTGWYDFKVPSSSLIWGSSNFYPSCGYVRDGKLFTYYHRVNTSSGLTNIGLRVYNVTSGTQEDDMEWNIIDNLDRIVWFCAYDTDDDLVYMVTSRSSDANAYQSVVYNPSTDIYTRLGDLRDSDFPIAMAWSPVDGNVYSLKEDGSVWRLDKNRGSFSQAFDTGHQISDYSGAMVYSPKDGGFVVASTDYDDYELAEVWKFTLTGDYMTLGYMQNDEQWLILHTDDPYAVAAAPAAATLVSWDFTGASTSGTLTLKMPSQTVGGSSLSGSVFFEVTADDAETPVYDSSVQPGANVAIPLTLAEGLHTLKARGYVYQGITKSYGLPLRITKYVGNDTPLAPSGVTLTESRVSWTAPGATGVNGGYVQTSALRYNVYINGTQMNTSPVSGTSLSITLPGGAPTYVAEVEAVANGKASARGTSAELIGSGALTVPFYLGPAYGEQEMTQAMRDMFTVVNANGDNRTWIYDEQEPHTGGFYYLCSHDNDADDWLILPAATFKAGDVYKFSFEAWAGDHYFSNTERFEVCLGSDKTPASMQVILPAQEINKAANFSPIDAMFTVSEPGEKYLAIHCISDVNKYRLYARRFRVDKAEASMSAPGPVTNLTATAAADGHLTATVSFMMPTVDVEGNALSDGTQVTAIVKSSVDTKEVTAAAGANASVEVAAVQGANTFTVTSKSSEGEGATTSVEAVCGVDVPGNVLIEKTVSADNRTITLNWSVPKRGANGGPVLPEDCTFTLMRNNGQTWVAYKDLGKATNYSMTVDEGPLQIVQLGILASNPAGDAPSYATASDVLGTPYGLPMHETWPYEGETVNMTYDPYMIEALTELYPTWGFVDPGDLVDKGVEPNESGIALTANWLGMSKLHLPKFSTRGMNNVKFDFSSFFGLATPASFQVLGTVDNDADVLLAEFTQASGKGWETKTVDLPAHFQNRDWVELSIVVNITSYDQYFLLDEYTIRNYPDSDLSVASFTGDFAGNIGNTLNFEAGVRNLGSEAVAAPQAKAELLRQGQVLATFTPTPSEATIEKNGEVEYTFAVTPGADLLGGSLIRFSIVSDDSDLNNNSAEADFDVFANNVPVPQNLAVEVTGAESNAQLTWNEPVINFGAEEVTAGAYGERLGAFRNIDGDGLVPYALGSINYLDRYVPKGFQVLDMATIPLPPLVEGAGQRILATMASGEGVQNNMLISPEIVGGSDVAFRIACASHCDGEEYLEENISLMVSTTTDDPAAFTELENFSHTEVSWKECKATLPADAKYFALRYAGVQKNFCLFIDNIRYIPAAYDGTLKGYSVYRSDLQTPTVVEQRTWLDTSYDRTRPTAWNVRSRMDFAGTVVESEASDAVILNGVGVGELDAASSDVRGMRGFIEVRNNAGNVVSVATADGRIVTRRLIDTDDVRISLAPGIYFVTAGQRAYKVVVK